MFVFIALSASAATRPNVVMFIADDLTWHDCGAYGATDVHTPRVDAFAKEAMKFQWAYAASPTCTPARSSLFTGIYPMRNGAHANHSLVNDGIATLPVYFKEFGYRVVIAGKTHIGPRSAFPFEYLPNSNIMPPGKKGVLYTDLNTAAVEQLLATHDQKVPLCLIVAAHSPHVYWLPNNGYDPAKINLPPYLLDTPETRSMRCDYYTDVGHMDDQFGDLLASLDKHAYTQHTLTIFTSDQGAQWPFSKWTLYEAGIRIPLLIRWPGKVKAGVTTEAMVSGVDLLPTMLDAAGGEPPKDIDGQSFLKVLTGETNHFHDEIYASHTGDKEMNHAPMRCVRTAQYKYIVNLRPDIKFTTHISDGIAGDGRFYFDGWVARAKTDPHAKAVVDRYYHKPPEELYDLSADPWELHTLAGDPAHADVLAQLREKVKKWRLQQGEDLNKVPLPEDAHTGPIRYAG